MTGETWPKAAEWIATMLALAWACARSPIVGIYSPSTTTTVHHWDDEGESAAAKRGENP